jgi:hypothetical protein
MNHTFFKKFIVGAIALLMLSLVPYARADIAGDLAAGATIEQAIVNALNNNESLDSIMQQAKAANLNIIFVVETVILVAGEKVAADVAVAATKVEPESAADIAATAATVAPKQANKIAKKVAKQEKKAARDIVVAVTSVVDEDEAGDILAGVAEETGMSDTEVSDIGDSLGIPSTVVVAAGDDDDDDDDDDGNGDLQIGGDDDGADDGTQFAETDNDGGSLGENNVNDLINNLDDNTLASCAELCGAQPASPASPSQAEAAAFQTALNGWNACAAQGVSSLACGL